MAEGADISIKKCMTRKHLSICLVLMNLMQNIPVSGRVFNKKLINNAFFMKKRRIIKIFIDLTQR